MERRADSKRLIKRPWDVAGYAITASVLSSWIGYGLASEYYDDGKRGIVGVSAGPLIFAFIAIALVACFHKAYRANVGSPVLFALWVLIWPAFIYGLGLLTLH